MPDQKAPLDLLAAESAWADAARFLRSRWLIFCGVSALVAAPCFWQRRIEAGDLASHVYNAWLAQLIERGQAPGLWIARQWNNVLFDWTLSAFASRFGFVAAEKIAVCAAVLIFFWGAFALASAAAGRAAWSVAPCLAMVAYGWTFQMGFLNYYLSLGFAFFGLALLWRVRGRERIATLALAPLIWLAHPLGLVLLVGACAWVIVAQRSSWRGHLIAGGAAAAGLVSVRLYILGNYPVYWPTEPRYFFNGLDQLLLYGPQYRMAAILLLVLVIFGVSADLVRRRRVGERWIEFVMAAELYALALLTILLLPAGIILPRYAAPAGFLHERLSCICAVFACCTLGVVRPRKWQCAGFALAAAVFFFYLYRDTARINRMEEQAERLVRTIPAGQRVLATIDPPDGSRVFIFHIADRACIGHCFSYGNYEPGSGQFRVRATQGNRFVTTSMDASFAIQKGEYTVALQDLPMFQIYQCKGGVTELCIRELSAGEVNGRTGLDFRTGAP